MPREARCQYNGKFYHVMTQGINKEKIFYSDKHKKIYIKLIFDYAKKENIKIVTYCIMTNHAHLLLNIKNTSDMSEFMKMVNMKFAMIYNRIETRVGVVFRNRYESELISNEKYFYNCVNYIHNNPVKAGIVKKAIDYKFSGAANMSLERILSDIKNNYRVVETFENFIDIEDEKNKNILNNIDQIVEKFKRNKNINEISLKDKRMLRLLIVEIKSKTNAKNCDIAKKLRNIKSINNKLFEIKLLKKLFHID